MLKNRKFAITICTIIIIFSIFSGARRSLSELVTETESAFIYGVNGDGKSIYHDLNTRAGLAYNLTSIAERYLGSSDSLVANVKTAAGNLESANRPAKCYDLNLKLTNAVNKLNNALLDENLSETDEKYRAGIMTDLESYDNIISHDGYNDLVRELNNKTLEDFPARVLKVITFVAGAEYYR